GGFTVVVDATARAGRVAADRAVIHRQSRLAGRFTVVVDATAKRKRKVVAQDAIVHRQRGMVVVDAAAAAGWKHAGGIAVGNGQIGDGYCGGVQDVEHTAVILAVHRQSGGSGAQDGDILVHHKFTARQQDGADDAGHVE